MNPDVWLSGHFLPLAEARIPITSQTLLTGVGLFETLRLVGGKAPLLELHLDRLQQACQSTSLSFPSDPWKRILEELSLRNQLATGTARIMLGDGFRLATLAPLPTKLAAEQRHGIALESRQIQRCVPGLKSTSRLAEWQAEQKLAGEVLIVSSQGQVLETTRSNFFIFSARGLETAPCGAVLPGIARRLVLDLARRAGIPIRQQAPGLEERGDWREAFVTNAVRGVRPVRTLDGQALPVAGNDRDCVTRQLQRGLDHHLGRI